MVAEKVGDKSQRAICAEGARASAKGRRELRLEVGGRYVTNNGCVVTVTEKRALDCSRLTAPVPDGWRVLCLGHCETYADGTPADSHIPLAWFENGFYGAMADHPLRVRRKSPVAICREREPK